MTAQLRARTADQLLRDRVLQNVAWRAAGLLGWPDTFDVEYVTLIQLHAGALITLDGTSPMP